MIVAIGNAPSSGSTLLADLLDSLPFALCGPELHLLSVSSYYGDFARLKKAGFGRASTPCLAARYSVRLSRSNIAYYGTTIEETWACLRDHSDFASFCRDFFSRYALFRKRSVKVFFEKTPENIHTASFFLSAFPEGQFVHIVRDPADVIASLTRRNIPIYVATATWLIDVAAAFELSGHPRFHTVHYEDLVRNPQRTVAELLEKLGITEDCSNLETLYAANEHRRTLPRVGTWSTQFGAVINPSNAGGRTRPSLNQLLECEIRRSFAHRFGVSHCGFQELMRYFGYVCMQTDETSIRPTRQSDWWLFRKWLRDFVSSQASVLSLSDYLRPIICPRDR